MNPVRLAIELFCRGVRLDASCDLAKDARGIRRTRAGLGSGLEVVLPGRGREHWVNVPTAERFAQESPITLAKVDGAYRVTDARSGEAYPVRLPTEPEWYARRTSSGREMTHVGVLQGTYLGIYVGGV